EHQLLAVDVAELYLVKIPGILVHILPITLLVALLYTLTNLARHQEITAMRAAGVSLWRLCMPYFAVGFLLSALVFAMNEFWVPDSQAKQDQIMDRRLHPNGVNPALPVQTTLGFPNARDNRTWVWDSFNFATDVMTNPKVDWEDPHGQRWNLLAKRAEYVNGVWMFYGNTVFTTNDFINLDSLAAKFKQPSDPLSQFLSAQLSSASLGLIAHHTNGPDVELKRNLTGDFNRIVRRGPIYDEPRFAGVKLPPSMVELAGQKRHGTDLIVLNRALLTEAYPQELSRNSINTVTVTKPGAVAHLSTNMLAMPQFSETPRDFANEARFNSRFQKLTADSAGVPIVEILDYLKLHPDQSPKNKCWLYTQLHGRFAEPWSCLVVVLIAIPFGAASGRRNIFVGVAGSIVIVFGYFILFRLGLALGTGGLMPAWLAAWLPNAVFGVTGFWMILRVR
ncbi:MAG: lipopolysaccharide transporter permease LptF, partial [Pedosphaera sp.]|nr:lipopolysaccharide transporter permease LptF [Pedosphaera sp.]